MKFVRYLKENLKIILLGAVYTLLIGSHAFGMDRYRMDRYRYEAHYEDTKEPIVQGCALPPNLGSNVNDTVEDIEDIDEDINEDEEDDGEEYRVPERGCRACINRVGGRLQNIRKALQTRLTGALDGARTSLGSTRARFWNYFAKNPANNIAKTAKLATICAGTAGAVMSLAAAPLLDIDLEYRDLDFYALAYTGCLTALHGTQVALIMFDKSTSLWKAIQEQHKKISLMLGRITKKQVALAFYYGTCMGIIAISFLPATTLKQINFTAKYSELNRPIDTLSSICYGITGAIIVTPVTQGIKMLSNQIQKVLYKKYFGISIKPEKLSFQESLYQEPRSSRQRSRGYCGRIGSNLGEAIKSLRYRLGQYFEKNPKAINRASGLLCFVIGGAGAAAGRFFVAPWLGIDLEESASHVQYVHSFIANALAYIGCLATLYGTRVVIITVGKDVNLCDAIQEHNSTMLAPITKKQILKAFHYGICTGIIAVCYLPWSSEEIRRYKFYGIRPARDISDGIGNGIIYTIIAAPVAQGTKILFEDLKKLLTRSPRSDLSHGSYYNPLSHDVPYGQSYGPGYQPSYAGYDG